MLKPTPEELPLLAKESYAETKKYFQKLKKRQQKRLDPLMQDLHDKEFAKTNCLDCGNCFVAIRRSVVFGLFLF